jgi:dihydrofolate synthase / folylpolyglutamate synthase
VLPLDSIDRQTLVRREADYYLGPESSPYNSTITYKDNLLISAAGIDRSNGDGNYVLLPADAQASANALRRQLRRRAAGPVGVLITDSRSVPARRGAIGVGIAHSGFAALETYAGKQDIFGRQMVVEVANIIDGLACAAVVAMGEGAQSTPLALIEDLSFVHFQDRDPTAVEIAKVRVAPEDDVYSEMLKRIPWDKRPQG